jgi:hypothetical protein
MKRTLFAIVAAALLTLPVACMHPGMHGGPGGPGGSRHQGCGCRQQAAECKCPGCECKKGGECKCGHKAGYPMEPHQHEQAPAAPAK